MITAAVLLASMLFTGSGHAQQSCQKASGDCLEAHGLPGCADEPCCESICGFDPFCCDEWDADCVELADLTCTGLRGATASGSCFFPNGSPACDDRTCCQAICLTDPFCCAQIWDANCSLFAGFICEIPGGECGDQGTGDCFEANGSPSCEDAKCCESVCAIDSSCCDGVWDALCVALAEQACGGLCVVGTSESDLVEAEGCDGASNDPCTGGSAEVIPNGARIHGTFANEEDVDVLSLDPTAVDLDGDGFVRIRMLFTANAAILKLRGVACDSTAEFEIASSACLPAVINQCVPVGNWIMEITPTGAGLGCEEPAWRLELEVADTCGPICGRPDSCLQPHAHPGCSDSDCCQLVCQQDPACCDWTWDSTCALQAADLCGGDPPANDQCAAALELGTGLHSFQQLLSTPTGPDSSCLTDEVRDGDVWFRHRATCDFLRVGTCSLADFDTVVDVYRGECGTLVPVDCVDDDVFCTLDTASLFLEAECGVLYLIRISGVAGSNGNGTLEIDCLGTECSCPGDLDFDGVVGGSDFGLLLSAWGKCSSDCPADLDGDGGVGGPDVGLLLAAWGDC